MAQNSVDYSGNPSGAELMDDYLAKEQDNILTSNSGVSRPSYAQAGTVWVDTSVTPWLYKLFDGAQDIVLGKIDTTNNKFIVSTPMTSTGDIMVQGTNGNVTRLGAGTAGYVLTSNGPGQLPSYQTSDLTEYGKLAGNNTWTGTNTFSKTLSRIGGDSYGFIAQNNNINIGQTPSVNQYIGYDFRGNNGTRGAYIGLEYRTSGEKFLAIQNLNNCYSAINISTNILVGGTLDASNNSKYAAYTSWVNSRISSIMNNGAAMLPNWSNFGDITSLLSLWNTSYTFGNNGWFFLTVEIGSQTNPRVNVYMRNSGTASTADNLIGSFGHNGGTAERNWSTLTVPVKSGNSVYLEKTGGGYATLTKAIVVYT